MTRLVDLPTPALVVDAGALDAQPRHDGRRPARRPAAPARQGAQVHGAGPPPGRRRPPRLHLRHDPRGRGHGRGRPRRRPAARQRGRSTPRRLGRWSRPARRVTVAVDSDGDRSRPPRPAASARSSSTSTSACPAAAARPSDAGRLADLARAAGLAVRGVMGYEGHVVGLADRAERDRAVPRVDGAAARPRTRPSAASSSRPAAPAPTTSTRGPPRSRPARTR